MTSRKRNNSSTPSSDASRNGRFGSTRSARLTKSSRQKRKHLLETLESRQLLAGPQLIGIQPNDGELIVNGTIRETAPRVLTLRFDANQQLDPSTVDGVRVTRSGPDDTFGTADDVQIQPGLVTLGDPNEVVVRFSDRLPDDNYRIEVFGFDDDGLGITGLRNQMGELLQPSVVGERAETIDFELRLGALVESVVPQPVVRLEDGTLVQNRNEIVIYFNEDPLFVEDDSAEGRFGNGTEEIVVTADIARSFDNVTINFQFNPNAGVASATRDLDDDSILVTYHPGNTFKNVADAIDALDGINAEVGAGVDTTAFTEPADVPVVRGNPTLRSAENPRFYQLLLTEDTVRTTDDTIYNPTEVIYDPATFTARLFFDGDINNLPGVPVGGGTFRLRVGTAVNKRVDLILPPLEQDVQASAVTDFQVNGLRVTFTSRAIGENGSGRRVRFEDVGALGLAARYDAPTDTVVFNFGGDRPTVDQLIAEAVSSVDAQIGVSVERDGVAGDGGDVVVPLSVVDAPPLVLQAVGDTLGTALDVGIFGQFNALKSVVLSESIDPQPFDIELAGGADDPGHTSEIEHINDLFGADTTDGITEIPYNFNGIFDTDMLGNDFLNQITERQKVRIREALNLWASKIGVQFRETRDQGITFALGDTAGLQDRGLILAEDQPALDAAVRVDPTFTDSAMVFSNQVVFGTNYGEDFTRKAVAGIGLMLGLNEASDLPAPSIMSFSIPYLNAPINALTDLEPVFPNNFDVLHGQYVHRTDSLDIDLYRFEVDLADADKVGTLTAETFAERLPDSSLLDTSLTLFQEVAASTTTDLGVGSELEITIDSLLPGRLGNNSRLDFIQTDRGPGDTAVRVLRALDASGNPTENGILIDLPRRGVNVPFVSAGSVVDAINDDPFASSIFRASITTGDASIDISEGGLSFSPVLLRGGGLEQVSRNDDYFGEDSRIVASLGEGIYYIGVSASGNDSYDPTIPGTGFGGRTQGLYDLQLKFEPQVDEIDVIRDLDSERVDVPGTRLDGDGDGVPGGVHNFWFQTRPLNRLVEFTDNGEAITPGQTLTIVSGSGVTRTYEFVPDGGSPRPGNIAVNYSALPNFSTPAFILANQLAAQVNTRLGETGVSLSPIPGTSTVRFEGERSVTFSDDFRGVDVFGRNIFVDKTAGPLADGSLDRPFNNISNPVVPNAFGSTLENDIVRIVGNGGADNNIVTEVDNFSYQIGISDVGGRTLEDGRNMEVPRGVTTMIDAGVIIKLRSSFIGIGSSTVQVNRAGGALQVLGTPSLVQLSTAGEPVKTTVLGNENSDITAYDDGSVIFTSVRDRIADRAAAGISLPAASGNWGGLIYRRDLDQAEGRRDLEDEGIFLQRVNHAEIRYGGNNSVLIDSVPQLVNPIQIVNMRPTVTFNEITESADSAISAAPNSFEETSYQAPRFQQAGAFTADYDRIGPDISNNLLLNNSINGLFVRATTTPTDTPREFTVAARFDDVDIVHYVSENLIVAASPGGSIEDGFAPSMSLVSAQALSGGDLPAGDYLYKMTFVDGDGFESLESPDQLMITVPNDDSSVELASLPLVTRGNDYVSRRLYRADAATPGDFRLVAELDASTPGFIDDGVAGDAQLDLTRQGIRGRVDASLVMDPGLITKLRGARFELGQGTQLLAEGIATDPVVFTSSLNDEFGAGGTFDTNNDNETITGAAAPNRADWSGIYAGPTSNISFDNVHVSYAGGISLLEGGLARGFLPLELQQAEGRITNSVFEFNDAGQAGAGPIGRFGRLAITPATIMVRGSQPIIVGNTFEDNRGSIIDIDIESMGANYRIDIGRQTGDIDRFTVLDDNHGPMIRFNRYLNDVTSGSQLSGLEVRAGTIATSTVFDDTDIAHLLFQSITVPDFNNSGGLRLLSRPDESLVVKFAGPGFGTSPTAGTGITATGQRGSIEDRIGGTVHVIGLPGAPVILTSLNDDSAGAGLKPDGSQFTDHDGDGIASRPFANDWRGLYFDQNSNDFNIPVIPELELSTEVAPGLNSNVDNAQFLGELAADLLTGDHVRRLGFEVDGFLSGPKDIDVYSFIGTPGSEVWIDIDRTSFTLDTVIELLNENGEVLARSDNSFEETALGAGSQVTVFDPDLQGVTTSLQSSNELYTERGVGGLIEDFDSTNPRDAGIHFRLAGNSTDPEARSVYFFRVRSAAINPDDAQGGITGGAYRFQARLTEEQAFPGSVVRFADIRYSNTGVHFQGLMSSSPLLGEAQENEAAIGFAAHNNLPQGILLGQGAQYVGNFVNTQRPVIGIGGVLSDETDVDLYRFDVDFARSNGLQSTIFDIDYAAGFNRPDTNISIFYDLDGVPAFDEPPNFPPQLVYFGSSSNVSDDLVSPLGENAEIEKLIRGSVSNGDPLVGPVSLPEGSYYIAVTADGVDPSGLFGTVREPINSIDRIVEDRVDRINPEPFSTANGPLLPRLFSDARISGSGFSLDVDAAAGHGKPSHFDGTTGPPIIPTGAPRIPEFVATGGGDAADGIDLTQGLAGVINLDTLPFSVDDDFEIGGAADIFGVAPNTSTTIPHVSIAGNMVGDVADFYAFNLAAESRVILDIDNGFDPNGLAEGFDFDPTNVDTELVILQFLPATTSLAIVDPPDQVDEALSVNDGREGSNTLADPFIDTVLGPGFYFVGVVTENSVVTVGGTTATVGGAASGGFQADYTLHVSIEDHVLPPPPPDTPGPGDQVLESNSGSGSITSEPFDLAGYSVADQPFLYFNRLYTGTNATVRATSNENPGGSVIHVFTAGGWQQQRVSLDAFAGHTNIQLTVSYGNGLMRLDDFIIGFAERGETVFGAATGTDFIIDPLAPPATGEYQLEVRRATDYSSNELPGPVVLTDSFDTNDRHNRSVTLVAPAGSQINDGDTFVLGDGAANSVFEFTTTPNTVTFGNTPVLYNATFTPAQVAQAIRTSVNSQTAIEVEAAGADGSDTETLTDGRLAISGGINGTFFPVASARAVPAAIPTDADGHLLLPAILHDGKGDDNFLRPQGQVIVEHNEFSDIRNIGVWSEPGLRDFSPEHVRNNVLLETMPVGNAYPGAVQNLPTLNNSVLGGLAPGIVIENNTFDHVEYAGVKLDGQIAPLTLEMFDANLDGLINGDDIIDGSTFAIEAADTRVVFEFEDIGDGNPAGGGSGTEGGDGWRDGHVPVYYRQTDDAGPSCYLLECLPTTHLETLHAIRESIHGSILVTNGLVELVDTYIGPSLETFSSRYSIPFGGGLYYETPSLYLEGASSILFPAPGAPPANLIASQAPIYEAPQPFGQIVNNTFYGEDGTESAFPEPISEPNDFLVQATETNIGNSHRDPYVQTATLGDNDGPLGAAGDVDFYKVYLNVGDVVAADIDTGAGGPDTVLQVFDASGVLMASNDNAAAPPFLDPQATGFTPFNDVDNGRDAYVDFTAPVNGTYFIGVSSAGNEDYDAQSLSGRVDGTGGTGTYTIGIEAYAPRSFVISLANGSGMTGGGETDRTGSTGADLLGTTFSVTPADGSDPVIMTFGGNIPIGGTFRDVDIMRAIELAIPAAVPGTPVSGPVVTSLGGRSGGGPDLFQFPTEPRTKFPVFGRTDLLYSPDHNTGGYGHNRAFPGDGSTEKYAFVERVAEIELSPQAIAAGLRLDPQPGRDADQLLYETGVMIAGGASPTLLNNVFLNLHEAIVSEVPQLKPQEVIVVGNAFQHPDGTPTQFNDDLFLFGVGSKGITSSTSNVNGGTDDFNLTLSDIEEALQFPEGNNFQPDFSAILIDSSVASVNERAALVTLKDSVGLPITNILAPLTDVAGIVRGDNPDFAPPGGIGASVFIDRGSNELADFIGPVAIAEVPRDNDAEGIDSDPAIGVINLTGGIYEEFRIQLRDNGDASDPFAGIGIDDATVVVPEIPGVRPTGANVTLFENERLLTQDVDYTFNFDETKNIITLTPLAGIWKNDRSYRFALNNRDRDVLIAPDPSEVEDGEQIAITDTQGGTVIFEFESGYQLFAPEPITLVVPSVGTNAGGLSDGDIFQINDGVNPVVIFEFNSGAPNQKLPGTVEVRLPTPTPSNDSLLPAFLNQIARNIESAIQSQIDAGLLDVTVRIPDTQTDRVVVGAERGTSAITSGSGLQQPPRTLALQVPADGVSATGIRDGDLFSVSNGNATIVFEFDTGGGLNVPTSTPVPVNDGDDAATTALAISQAISTSSLGLSPQVLGEDVYLNLPVDGAATAAQGQLNLVGLSRTANDGDLIVVTPNTGIGQELTLEINRTDEPDPTTGLPMDDGVTIPNVEIEIDRTTTADELTAAIETELESRAGLIDGLNAQDIVSIPGGLLVVGGEQGLGFSVTGNALEVAGSPEVTGASTIQVFGPLLLQLPLVGGGNIFDGSVLILTDDTGNDVVFEFNLNGTQPTVAGAIVVAYNTFDTVDILGDNLVLAINTAMIGITAQNLGTGRISLGRIAADRVNTGGIPDLVDPTNSIPGVPQITTRRGIVSDGEILSIRQGTDIVVFEFESIIGGGGLSDPQNIAVAFQPGSTVGDIAISLAAAINNNKGNLQIEAVAEEVQLFDENGDPVLDENGDPVFQFTGQVLLDDVPGTVIDVTAAPTLNLIGVPGGAIPIRISPAFSATEVKRSILNAFNSINEPGELPVTTLMAEDRGGATFFVENGEIFRGPLVNYFLPGMKDLAGNLLEPNRDDLTTQFTILMPTVQLDYGDAIDPVLQVPGRYPTLFENDGPRHVVENPRNFVAGADPTRGTPVILGRYIDADLDGQPNREANGDDTIIDVFSSDPLFSAAVIEGAAEIVINAPANPVDFVLGDEDTVTIDTGLDQATLEFDVNGRFNEDNFAVRPVDGTSAASIAEAVIAAIAESPLDPAGVFGGFRLVGSDSVELDVSNVTSLLSVDGFSKTKVLQIKPGVDSATLEGETFTITVAGQSERFEFDTDDIVTNGVAVKPDDTTSVDSIAAAIRTAIAGSVLGAGGLSLSEASVFIVADDEDGVSFISETNPTGVLNKGVVTPISVTVTGAGVLEAWIDFNADGDWTDPGEQIITPATDGAIFSDAGTGVERVFNITVPVTTPDPIDPILTYARFRVSRTGDLEPTGLALSGETEDYAVLILPGAPPQIPTPNLTYTATEDLDLLVSDAKGVTTPTNPNDNGLLANVTDPQGDTVEIFAEDVGTGQVLFALDATGQVLLDGNDQPVVAGLLDLASDGTFRFDPADDFNGVTTFTARVTDRQPFDPQSELINSVPISVTINVEAVNDKPVTAPGVSDVVITRTIDEDVTQVFSVDTEIEIINGNPVLRPGLIAGNYVPGPQNESDQPLVIQSAGAVFRGSFMPFRTSQGGVLTIADDGRSITYDPPEDFNSGELLDVVDTFTYVVADVPGAGLLVETADTLGTVSITVNAVNDPPIALQDDYGVDEDTLLIIPIVSGDPLAPGILDNDSVGPADEVAEDPTVTLVAGQFPKATFRGGEVRPHPTDSNLLVYDPPFRFSGIDQFEYDIQDPQGEVSSGIVRINIGGVNNGPIFVGIDGIPGQIDIVRDESKQDPQQQSFDLNTWFSDPEGDTLTYEVSSTDSSIVAARLIDEVLILDFPPFAFGQATLIITATDPDGASTLIQVPVTVNDTPDPPTVVGSLGDVEGFEDQAITRSLTNVFADPDGAPPLTYSVLRIDNLNITDPSQISQHPLIQSITFANDAITITPKANQFDLSGVEIEIAAKDDSFQVSDTFTLKIAPVADRPVANVNGIQDGYNVPVGARLQILNPTSGVLANDGDADGDAIFVDLTTIVGPGMGTLDINADGTFSYTNTSGAVGEQDSFTYRVRDETNRFSDPVTVTFTLNQSRYQNPLQNLSRDVNADGFVTAIDALRIINFLDRELLDSGGLSVPVSQIGTPPPDYYDTSGDGSVSALDALLVINQLGQQNVASPELVAGLGVSSNVAAASTAGMPSRNVELSSAETETEVGSIQSDPPRDRLLAEGLSITPAANESVVDLITLVDEKEASSPENVDDALALVLDEISLDQVE